MSLIRSILGRRKFIFTLLSSAAAAATSHIGPAKKLGLLNTRPARAMDSPNLGANRPLKAIVVYYSATGSTAKVAGAIYRGLKSVMDCDISPVGKMNPETMARYDLVLVGTPIWFFRETANVRIFVNDMPHMAGKLCAVFCTHGTEPAGTFYSMSQPLRKKALTIIGWNDWYGDTTHYIHAVQPYITHGHPDAIDLEEAETFGREMAERAQRIYAGEKDLIPEIPDGPDADNLWVRSGVMADLPSGGGRAGAGADGPPSEGPSEAESASGRPEPMPGGEGSPGGHAVDHEGFGGNASGQPVSGDGAGEAEAAGPHMEVSMDIPVIDTTKCVYPRCTACMDNCIVGAIDLSRTSPAASVSESPIFIQGCVHCGFPMCQRACRYDAISYKGQRHEYTFDMGKCTYPKCTLCIDHCGMKSIEFSSGTLTRHNTCEGCDLCWSICPEDAIELANFVDMMDAAAMIRMLMRVKQTMPKFRPLIPDGEWGVKGKAYENPKAPRVVLNETDWPYDVKVH